MIAGTDTTSIVMANAIVIASEILYSVIRYHSIRNIISYPQRRKGGTCSEWLQHL